MCSTEGERERDVCGWGKGGRHRTPHTDIDLDMDKHAHLAIQSFTSREKKY